MRHDPSKFADWQRAEVKARSAERRAFTTYLEQVRLPEESGPFQTAHWLRSRASRLLGEFLEETRKAAALIKAKDEF